jgi:hypothetical protein
MYMYIEKTIHTYNTYVCVHINVICIYIYTYIWIYSEAEGAYKICLHFLHTFMSIRKAYRCTYFYIFKFHVCFYTHIYWLQWSDINWNGALKCSAVSICTTLLIYIYLPTNTFCTYLYVPIHNLFICLHSGQDQWLRRLPPVNLDRSGAVKYFAE